MKRVILAVVAIVGILALGTTPAAADAVYHSEHVALRPVGGAQLRIGFVENIHANGPQVFALERYVVVGAKAFTTFDVALHIWLDPACDGAELASLPTATFTTNVSGNGVGMVALPPSAADGLHGATLGIAWTVSSGGSIAYRTDCVTVVLD